MKKISSNRLPANCTVQYQPIGRLALCRHRNNRTAATTMSAEPVNKQEKYFFYNSLAILLKAVEGERTTVDLRNEASIYGTVEQADGYMNIVMKDCIFTDPRGDRFPYEIFFVQARNIRYVHIPSNIPIIPAIKNQLRSLSGEHKDPKSVKPTFKSKRTKDNQQAAKDAVERILKEKSEKLTSNPGE